MTDSAAETARVTTSIAANGVAQVTLSRADKLNALDKAMFEGLIDAGATLAAMPDLRCVVLTGAGKGFCAGIDLSLFGASPHGEMRRWPRAAMAGPISISRRHWPGATCRCR